MFKNINKSLNTSLKALEEMRNIQGTIEKTLLDSIKQLPKDQADQVEGIKVLMQKVVNLSKQGKQDEANELINSFRNGSKNN